LNFRAPCRARKNRPKTMARAKIILNRTPIRPGTSVPLPAVEAGEPNAMEGKGKAKTKIKIIKICLSLWNINISLP
ncbi:MAG: hypothetical protein Q7J61_03270, partial [Deltaproteobacteria bacterium]|nr:hypothetical protein [Deltaproteobacteria bacterium]